METFQIREHVQKHYSTAASAPSNARYAQSVAHTFGYSESELASIPKYANLGLSCGNPLALASLKKVNVSAPDLYE